MSNPKHLPDGIRRTPAIAPYNFVELPEPEQLVHAQDAQQPVEHTCYHEERHTGRIECTLTTASPLYVRCALTAEQFAQGEEAKKQTDFFYLHEQGQPVIPGSSLRGMLRTLVEIAGFGKIAKVTDNKPFFRTLTDHTTKEIYNEFFVARHRRVAHRPHPAADCYGTYARTGFLVRAPNGDYVIRECESGRIKRTGIPGYTRKISDLYDGRGPGMTPSWKYQYQTIFVQIDPEEDHFFPTPDTPPGKKPRHLDMYLRYRAIACASFQNQNGLQEGVLVLTGNMQDKKMEFVFLKQTIAEHTVPDEMVRRFHDDDQISQWQEKAFPKDMPTSQCRGRDGMHRDGEPVFFLLDADGKVRFFGRAQNFRLPYPHSPRDFIPPKLRDDQTTDLADAIFGFVRDSKQQQDAQTRAGRIFVGDATLHHPQQRDVWLRDEPITPRILATPKPTTFQHYLVQPEDNRATLRHYASKVGDEDGTLIRGHKLYWHQGDVTAANIEDADFLAKPEGERNKDTQHTRITPVRSGVVFSFTIHFENLTDVELGVLLWVLNVAANDRYRLKLGMGKPLGMGAVKIDSRLVLNNRRARYGMLFDNDGKQWASGDAPASSDAERALVDAFRAYVQQGAGVPALEDSPRIAMLLAMLEWPGPQPVEHKTRYMEIERDTKKHVVGTPKPGDAKYNEYRERFVLPSPLVVDKPMRTPGTQPQRPAAPASPRKPAAASADIPQVGQEVTGNCNGTVRGGVDVKVNRVPRNVRGFIPKHLAGTKTKGGVTARVTKVVQEGTDIVLHLEPVKK